MRATYLSRCARGAAGAVCALALAACGQTRSNDQGGKSATGRPVILVGIDAGDWLAIDPLIKAGKLPAFSRIRSLGRTGLIIATPPLISPMLWTTIATGVEPENHGILDFMVDLPNGHQAPVGTSQRLAPALWNLFSEQGRRVAVVGWWATWPAEKVRGTIVSDALAPQLTRSPSATDAGLVSPPELQGRIAQQAITVSMIGRDDLASYIPVSAPEYARVVTPASDRDASRFYEDPVAHLAAIVASTRTYTAIAQDLLRTEHPDFLAVYFEQVDTVSHVFVRDATRGPQAIARSYEDADILLQRLATASPPDALFVVCSDHGFYPPTAAIPEDPANLAGPASAWHRPYGIVAVALARTIATGSVAPELSGPADIGAVTSLDIAPTVLHAAGLGVPTDMPGRVVKAMLPADRAAPEPRRIAAVKYEPPSLPSGGRRDDAEAVARLQALGYIGAVKTSLARQNLGESLLRRGKLAGAERELRTVVDAQPGNVSAHLWLAQSLQRQGRAREALSELERAIALPGGSKDALVPAVDLAISSGDFAAARRLSSSAGAPPGVRLVARGAIAEAQGDRRAAERAYRAALGEDPLSFDAAARLLDVLSASGAARQALLPIERAARLAPDSPRHLALVGQARLAAGDAPGAEIALRGALERAPDGASVRIALARALLIQQKWAQAVSVLDPAPASVDRDVLLGSAYSAQRDWDRAVQHLRAALDAGGARPTVLNALGWAELQAGRRDEAEQRFAQSLAAERNQPEIQRLLDQVKSGAWRAPK